MRKRLFLAESKIQHFEEKHQTTLARLDAQGLPDDAGYKLHEDYIMWHHWAEVAVQVRRDIASLETIAQQGLPTRQRLFQALRRQGASFFTARHPSAVIASDVQIGPGCMICANVVVNTGSVIGANVILNTGCTVDHHNHTWRRARIWVRRSPSARGR